MVNTPKKVLRKKTLSENLSLVEAVEAALEIAGNICFNVTISCNYWLI